MRNKLELKFELFWFYLLFPKQFVKLQKFRIKIIQTKQNNSIKKPEDIRIEKTNTLTLENKKLIEFV